MTEELVYQSQQDNPQVEQRQALIEQRRQSGISNDSQILEQKQKLDHNKGQESTHKCEFCVQLKEKLQKYKQQLKLYDCEDIMLIKQQMQVNNNELIKVKQLNENLIQLNLQLESVIEENQTKQDMISDQESFIKALKEQFKCQDQKLIQLQNSIDKQNKNNQQQQNEVRFLELLQSQCQHFFKMKLSKDIFEKINTKFTEMQKQIKQLNEKINKQNSFLNQQQISKKPINSIKAKKDDEFHYEDSQQFQYNYQELKEQIVKDQSQIRDLINQQQKNNIVIQQLNQENQNYLEVQQSQNQEKQKLINIIQELEQKISQLNYSLEYNNQQVLYFQEKAQKFFKRQFNRKIFQEINEDIKQTIYNHDILLKEYQNLKFYCDSINSEYIKYFQQHQCFKQQFQPDFFKDISDYVEDIIKQCQLDTDKVLKRCKKQIDQQMIQEVEQQQEIENLKKNCKNLQKQVQTNQIKFKQLCDNVKDNEEQLQNNIKQNEQQEHEGKKQFEIEELKKKIKTLENQLKESTNNNLQQLAQDRIKYDQLSQENQENYEKYIESEKILSSLRDQKNTLLYDALKEKQVMYFEFLNLKNKQENYEQKMKEIEDLQKENMNLIQKIISLKQLFLIEQNLLENQCCERIQQIQTQLNDKSKELVQLQIQLEQKQTEISFSILSIKNLEANRKKEEKIYYEEKQILKQNIHFILKKIQPNQKVQQITPLIHLLQQLTINQSNNKQIDPFNNEQIMTQEDQYSKLEIEYDYQPFVNIIQQNYPPDFDKIIILKEKQQILPIKRSINMNKTSSFFNGYFIQNLKENKNLYYIRELKFTNTLDSKQLLLSQLGNRQILHTFISEFNRELTNHNIAHPIIKKPPILCLKGDNQYYYCEQIIQNQNNNLDLQQTNLYLQALKYFSYCYSKGAYMITYILQDGSYFYDVIIASQYGLLSTCDQGQDEISKQASSLNPNLFNYSQYQKLMLKIKI